jgi:hypothetical protein
MTFNLNDYIKIKLTSKGYAVLLEHCAKYKCCNTENELFESYRKRIDGDGYLKIQAHDAMNIFGEHMIMGAPLVMEMNIIICDKEV